MGKTARHIYRHNKLFAKTAPKIYAGPVNGLGWTPELRGWVSGAVSHVHRGVFGRPVTDGIRCDVLWWTEPGLGGGGGQAGQRLAGLAVRPATTPITCLRFAGHNNTILALIVMYWAVSWPWCARVRCCSRGAARRPRRFVVGCPGGGGGVAYV